MNLLQGPRKSHQRLCILYRTLRRYINTVLFACTV